MKYVTIFFLFFIFSCNRDLSKERKGFSCSFDNNVTHLSEFGAKIYEEINFETYKEICNGKKDTLFEFVNLNIRFPQDLKSFSLKDSSICKFTLTKSGNYDKITQKNFNNGFIKCFAINEDLWNVEIRVDSLHYKGIISKKNNNSSYFKW